MRWMVRLLQSYNSASSYFARAFETKASCT
jgi:hypothetical protein